jgi:two-component system, LuxR family, response regulator FixJ
MPKEQAVYVIDDDDAVRSSICMLLETHGISGRPYASGAGFLEDLPRNYGCLLVDVDMPKMNGLELLDRLRGRGIAMPVIIMTGALTARIREVADRTGATLLRKPFRPGELIACIEKAFDRHRL